MTNYGTVKTAIRGKVKWAKTKIPNKFGKWSIDVYPDAEGLEKIKRLKEDPMIKNVLKKDDEGQYMSFSRDTQKLMRGKMVMFEPPIVLKADDTPLVDQLIGNGSDCDVLLDVYTFKHPSLGTVMRAARLHSIKVWNLVPFEPKKDFTEIEQIKLAELMQQPQPSW